MDGNSNAYVKGATTVGNDKGMKLVPDMKYLAQIMSKKPTTDRPPPKNSPAASKTGGPKESTLDRRGSVRLEEIAKPSSDGVIRLNVIQSYRRVIRFPVGKSDDPAVSPSGNGPGGNTETAVRPTEQPRFENFVTFDHPEITLAATRLAEFARKGTAATEKQQEKDKLSIALISWDRLNGLGNCFANRNKIQSRACKIAQLIPDGQQVWVWRMPLDACVGSETKRLVCPQPQFQGCAARISLPKSEALGPEPSKYDITLELQRSEHKPVGGADAVDLNANEGIEAMIPGRTNERLRLNSFVKSLRILREDGLERMKIVEAATNEPSCSDKAKAFADSTSTLVSLGLSGKPMKPAKQVAFHYLYCKGQRRKTEMMRGFTCPFCLLCAPDFHSLTTHLESTHDRFKFTFQPTQGTEGTNADYPCVIVMCRDPEENPADTEEDVEEETIAWYQKYGCSYTGSSIMERHRGRTNILDVLNADTFVFHSRRYQRQAATVSPGPGTPTRALGDSRKEGEKQCKVKAIKLDSSSKRGSKTNLGRVQKKMARAPKGNKFRSHVKDFAHQLVQQQQQAIECGLLAMRHAALQQQCGGLSPETLQLSAQLQQAQEQPYAAALATYGLQAPLQGVQGLRQLQDMQRIEMMLRGLYADAGGFASALGGLGVAYNGGIMGNGIFPFGTGLIGASGGLQSSMQREHAAAMQQSMASTLVGMGTRGLGWGNLSPNALLQQNMQQKNKKKKSPVKKNLESLRADQLDAQLQSGKQNNLPSNSNGDEDAIMIESDEEEENERNDNGDQANAAWTRLSVAASHMLSEQSSPQCTAGATHVSSDHGKGHGWPEGRTKKKVMMSALLNVINDAPEASDATEHGVGKVNTSTLGDKKWKQKANVNSLDKGFLSPAMRENAAEPKKRKRVAFEDFRSGSIESSEDDPEDTMTLAKKYKSLNVISTPAPSIGGPGASTGDGEVVKRRRGRLPKNIEATSVAAEHTSDVASTAMEVGQPGRKRGPGRPRKLGEAGERPKDPAVKEGRGAGRPSGRRGGSKPLDARFSKVYKDLTSAAAAYSDESEDDADDSLGAPGTYYHSRTCIPIEGEPMVDSDDDEDLRAWAREDYRHLSDFKDVIQCEKIFMHDWNVFMRRYKPYGDKELPNAYMAFAHLRGKVMAANPGLRQLFTLHLCNAWDFAVIDSGVIDKVLKVVDSYRDAAKVEMKQLPDTIAAVK